MCLSQLSNIQHIFRRITQPRQRFGADVVALVELLGLVTTAEVGVHGAPSVLAGVEGAAVPSVRVENDDGAGGRE